MPRGLPPSIDMSLFIFSSILTILYTYAVAEMGRESKGTTPTWPTRKDVRSLVGRWGIIIIKQRKRERDSRYHEREQSPNLQGQEELGGFRKYKNISPYYAITYTRIHQTITHTTP
ncbi:hypothetical protein AVEN_238987-1 [Araneus ventricosus]|uniref:Uncharacterized protein n=1 Tax=Araneus ventricosus TaxID=182803 RepID=A0A4Y2G207_ARAVE|nr:hypothetical protein AVEN_238987-1 [Araneus ventricosus]